MPSISGNISVTHTLTPVMSAATNAAFPSVDAEYLKEALRHDSQHILVLDCRTVSEYLEGHIRGAFNVDLPSLMLRRLASGKLSLLQVVRRLAPDAAEIVASMYTEVPVILYDYDKLQPEGPTLMTLCKRLLQEGCNVHCLRGGYSNFKLHFPEWCETTPARDSSLVGLTSLRISPMDDASHCDISTLGRDVPLDDLCFPVEILPHLFLGNARNSEDKESLNKHKIRYIVNVTPNLPNVFEESGSYKYMQIPIADHWNQNLASFFPQAIQFIDEAREREMGVLVHCLAGISRSVTITVAYLMFKKKLSLEDAYEYVRVKKANIDPNFNFMGQLRDFQQQLNLAPIKCQCQASRDCRCRSLHFTTNHASPDSGIEFDRYS